jgi:hypothetical protein
VLEEFGACAFSSNERQFLAACNVDNTAQLDFWDVRDGRVSCSQHFRFVASICQQIEVELKQVTS